jgi:ribosomal protein L37AE/L43A
MKVCENKLIGRSRKPGVTKSEKHECKLCTDDYRLSNLALQSFASVWPERECKPNCHKSKANPMSQIDKIIAESFLIYYHTIL